MKEKDNYFKKVSEEYEGKRKASKKLYEKACQVMPGGDTRTFTFFKPYPHFILKGEGAYVFDADHNKLVDFDNNYTSLIHGHGHKPTAKAVSEQIQVGSAYTAPLRQQIELAEILVNRFKSVDLVRFANSGTEANMHALRGARAYTNRQKIVKVEGGYHGTTDVFEANVDPNLKKAGSIDNIKTIADSRGVSKNALKDVLVVSFNNIEATKRIVEKNHEQIAAFIVEPIMSSAGQIVATNEYLEFVREITRHYKIVLIFDEVVTARLSYGGGQQVFNIQPDLTSFGKIIGGGLPIGGFGGKREIMDIYNPNNKIMYHSGTFNGNAISMAAGVAAMSDYNQEKIDYVNKLGTKFKDDITQMFKKIGLNIQLYGIGSIYNIIFSNIKINEYRGVATSFEGLNSLLFLSLLNKGVLSAQRGMYSMSTAMTENDIDFAVKAIEESLIEMEPVIGEVAPELLNK